MLIERKHSFVVIAVLATWFSQSSVAEAYKKDNADGVICGPRCAVFVAESYGIDLPLTTAIQKLQSPHLAAGCKLSDIERFLNELGLETELVVLGKHEVPNFNGTMIGCEIGVSDLGHFIVILESTSDMHSQVSVFDGLSGFGKKPSQSFFDRLHRTVLIVHNGEFNNSNSFRKNMVDVLSSCQAVVVAFILSAKGASWFYKKRFKS